jgi:hypothetical protein
VGVAVRLSPRHRLIANFTEDRRVVEHAIHTPGLRASQDPDPRHCADFQLTDLTREREGGDRRLRTLLNEVVPLAVHMQRGGSVKVRVGADRLFPAARPPRKRPGRKQIVYFSIGFQFRRRDTAQQAQTTDAVVSGRLGRWTRIRVTATQTRSLLTEAFRFVRGRRRALVDLSGLGMRGRTTRSGVHNGDSPGRGRSAISAETGGRSRTRTTSALCCARWRHDEPLLRARGSAARVQPGTFRKLQVG